MLNLLSGIRAGLGAVAAVGCDQRPVWDGGRLLPSAKRSDVDLLGDAQRVIEFDAEVSDRAVHFGVTKQELNGSEISGLPVDQRRFRPPYGMCSIPAWIEPDRRYPVMNKTRVLSRRDVG